MKNIITIITIAGAMISFFIGAGTASGQEILQFFTSFGYYGIGAILIAMVIHAWMAAYIMDIGHRLDAVNPGDVYRYLCGKYLGSFFEWFAQMLVFVVFVIMIAGGGATLTQYYGLNEALGRFIVAGLALVSVVFGLNKLLKILGVIGPIIVILTVIIGGSSFIINFDGFLSAGQVLSTIEIPKAAKYWWISGFIYSAFVIVAAAPFLASVGQNEPIRKNAIWGGIIGGISILTAVLFIYLGEMASLATVYTLDIPTLALADAMHPAFGIVFSIIIFLAIYSTATPMLWTVTNRLSLVFTKYSKSKITYKTAFRIIAICIAIIGFFGGLLPFGLLIGTIYPYIGYVGMLMFVGMLYRQFINKGNIRPPKSFAEESKESKSSTV